ncbi:hypothetical protein M8818_003449 [Zalaria obscura]|uniref:Uncharacterized protein n=1 Tax=Zalaria obscura TaxID=2024903 RepID=A0ACC3SEY6_9PEZI
MRDPKVAGNGHMSWGSVRPTRSGFDFGTSGRRRRFESTNDTSIDGTCESRPFPSSILRQWTAESFPARISTVFVAHKASHNIN